MSPLSEIPAPWAGVILTTIAVAVTYLMTVDWIHQGGRAHKRSEPTS